MTDDTKGNTMNIKDLNLNVVHHGSAESNGFAKFNRNPHLLVEVPNGGFTITCRTKAGKKVTFSFEAYEENGSPACVDVCHHTSPKTVMNGDHPCPVQEVLCFTRGRTAYVSKLEQEDPVTVTTVLLEPRPKV
jgi:Fe-S-cluster-containing dehydrogenase component